MQQFEVGTIGTLYVNFLTLENKEATSVVDPKITIRHIDSGGTLVTDVNEAVLTLATETMYFYKWDIAKDAYIGEYTVEYQGVVDGEYAEANENIQLLIAGSLGTTSSSPLAGTIYTTADKVAGYLGVTVDKIDVTWLDWASRYIDTYTCQKFSPITVTEKYDIEKCGQDYLFLDHYPVIDVAELKDAETVVDTVDYLIYEDEGRIAFVDDYILNILQTGAFTKGRQKAEVTYTYGYTTVPREIEWAATVLTASIARESLIQSGDISEGIVTEEQIGEYRRKKSLEDSSSSFSSSVEESKVAGSNIVQDVFDVKNILKIYKVRGMRAV